MTKIDLLIEPWPAHSYCTPGYRPVPLKRSLPFYVSRWSGIRTGGLRYIHRVRSGLLHPTPPWSMVGTHVSFRLWCGQSGSGTHGELLSDVPDTAVVCATCEGRAVGAGQVSVALLAVRPVRFSPRLAS